MLKRTKAIKYIAILASIITVSCSVSGPRFIERDGRYDGVTVTDEQLEEIFNSTKSMIEDGYDNTNYENIYEEEE